MLYMCWCASVAARGGVLWVIRPPLPLASDDGRIRPSCQLLSPASPSSALSSAAFWGARGELGGGRGAASSGEDIGTSQLPKAGSTSTGQIFTLSPPPSSFSSSSRKTKPQWLMSRRAWAGVMPCQQTQPWRARNMLSLQGKLPEKSRPGWYHVQRAQRRLDLFLTIIIV